MDLSREVLTTGQVAKICRVAPRTVSKWFDNGQLRGYRIPGSKDRRIPLAQLVRFMKAHGIPMEELEDGAIRVLVVDDEPDLSDLIVRALNDTGRFEARVAESAFEAGAIVDSFRPQVLLVDADIMGANGQVLSRYMSAHAELQGTRLIAMSASLTEGDRQVLLQSGFTDTLAKPFSIRELMSLLDQVAVPTL